MWKKNECDLLMDWIRSSRKGEKLLLAKILTFSANRSQIKNTETEFGGNRKVALILSWWREEHSRLMPQALCPLSMRSLGACGSLQSGVSDEEQRC